MDDLAKYIPFLGSDQIRVLRFGNLRRRLDARDVYKLMSVQYLAKSIDTSMVPRQVSCLLAIPTKAVSILTRTRVTSYEYMKYIFLR